MTSSGLVSLNVHDNLTFEGTELCLHPDLFKGRLHPGDLLEVKVWDAHQKGHNSSINTSSIIRRGSANNSSIFPLASQSSGLSVPQPIHSAASSQSSEPTHRRNASGNVSVSLNYSDTSLGDEESRELSEVTSRKAGETATVTVDNCASSAASSDAAAPTNKSVSPNKPATEGGSGGGGGGNDLPPTKTVDTGADLPPVAPRARLGTADRPVATKPPLQRRSLTQGSRGTNNKTTKQHRRDLSDMTADTACHESAAAWIDSLADDGLVDDPRSQTHNLRLSFVMLVTEQSLSSIKSSARTQVSVLRNIADLFKLSSYDMVSLHIPDQELALQHATADFVLVTIKDQFMSRGDMHLFQEKLIGKWVYEGQRLYEPSRGLQANAREIRHSEQRAMSGVITDNTTITFRSRSARIMWLVQMSSEMWEYSSPFGQGSEDECTCEIYFDKWISFAHTLFGKWKELEATHSLTVVFFSRTFLNSASVISGQKDVYGRFYEDHFRIIIDNETGPNWESHITRIKQAFVNYPKDVGWTLSNGKDARRPSVASQGNVLEAVNVTLNLLQFHYLDRDLQRTGNSVVVVSAGNGVFEVDRDLAGVTYQRMMDNGIGSDMLSLGLPALHIAPFFKYTNAYKSQSPKSGPQKPKGKNSRRVAETRNRRAQSNESEVPANQEPDYEVPHWMHLSFVSYESDQAVFVDNLFEKGQVSDGNHFSEDNDGMEILPNGFLLPRRQERAKVEDTPLSPGRGSVQFGISAASGLSPTRKTKIVSQERQLIAGRDFNDILEACRPRDGTKLPSALTAIMEIEGEMRDDEPSKKRSDQIEEWGAVEFTSLKASLKPSQSPSPSLVLTPSTSVAQSPQRHDSLDISIKASPGASSHSSSFASQLSGIVLGVSNEIKEVDCDVSGLKLQRTPSLEFDGLDDDGSDAVLTNDSNVTSDDGFQSEKRDPEKLDDGAFLSLMETMMKEHDSNRVRAASPKLIGMGEATGRKEGIRMKPSSNRQIQLAQQRRNSMGVPSSGLAAALAQSTGIGAVVAESEANATAMTRTKSVGRLASRHGTAPPSAGLGLSPLFLPPVGMAKQSYMDAQQRDPGKDIYQLEFVSQETFLRSVSKSPPGNPTMRETNFVPLSISPPTIQRIDSAVIDRAERHRQLSTSRRQRTSARKKAFNPFRQQDEEEVLSKRSFNRLRWSHVFPRGEVEFKRHAGPNWKSLAAPAILPLVVDYIPTQEDIDHNFTLSMYNVALTEFKHQNFSSTQDLLVEMVRQRITQDFQIVSKEAIEKSNYRREWLRGASARTTVHAGTMEQESPGTIRRYLSLGHRLQVLMYDPTQDIIEVTRYNLREAHDYQTIQYRYFSFCQETQAYSKVSTSFSKYTQQYNWNKLDRLICGDDDREMREGMRFKRVMFSILPDNFEGDTAAEEEYILKFKRLVEYFEKLRDKGDGEMELQVKFVTSLAESDQGQLLESINSTPGLGRNSMVRFYVQLRKGKHDILDYLEVGIDATLNTKWSYRIMFSWLTASSGKVEAQVNMLQRRCTQYGLKLVPVPQVTVSRNIYLNPLKSPAVMTIRDKSKANRLDGELKRNDFLHDGRFYTDTKTVLECLEGKTDFNFGMICIARQFVHRSGTLFVRILTDSKGLAIVVVLGNYRYLLTQKDDKLVSKHRAAFRILQECIDAINRESLKDA